MNKRSKQLLLFFFAGLLLTSYFGGKLLILYLILWTAMATIAFLYFQMLPATLPCTLELPGTCAKGKKIIGYLHVVQNGRLPIFRGVARIRFHSLYYKQEQTAELDIMLMGGEEGIAAFDLNVPYVGMMEITLEEAEIYGLFGIWKKTILSSMKKYLMVMPDTREIRMAIPDLGNIDPEGEEMRDSVYGYDPGMYQGIRPYREGDSMKHIHWKLTGKTGEIMVKELGIPSGREPRIYLDTALPDLNPKCIDQIIEDFFSFSMMLIHQNIPHIICWKSGGVSAEEYMVENLAMLEELMEPIFHIEFWEHKSSRKNTWVYFMDHEERSVYGFYHGEEDYLEAIVTGERLWNDGRV